MTSAARASSLIWASVLVGRGGGVTTGVGVGITGAATTGGFEGVFIVGLVLVAAGAVVVEVVVATDSATGATGVGTNTFV